MFATGCARLFLFACSRGRCFGRFSRWCGVLAIMTSANCVVFSSAARAGTILPPEFGAYGTVRPVAAIGRYQGETFTLPDALTNGAGLTHRHPLMAQHGSDPDTIWQMPITGDTYPVSLEFDLGGEFLLNEMWIWQLRGDGLEERGIRDFEIIMRDADGNEVAVLDSEATLLKSTGVQPIQRFNAFGECVFLPYPDCVRFIELRIHSNLGDVDWLGIGEILFLGREKLQVVPEPGATGALVVASTILLVRGRRRTRAAVNPL